MAAKVSSDGMDYSPSDVTDPDTVGVDNIRLIVETQQRGPVYSSGRNVSNTKRLQRQLRLDSFSSGCAYSDSETPGVELNAGVLREQRSKLAKIGSAFPEAPEDRSLRPTNEMKHPSDQALRVRTLRLHYYPEGHWGWCVLFSAILVQIFSTAIPFSSGMLMPGFSRRVAKQQMFKSMPNLAVLSSSSAAINASSYGNISQQLAVMTGSLAGLCLATSLLISPIAVAICRHKSTRLTAVLAGLLTALGLLFTSFAAEFHQLLLSYGILVGVGVGLTRDAATLMVGQYFKRKREAVEIGLVAAAGLGLSLMSVAVHTLLGILGWRLGLQAITGLLVVPCFLGSCYRSASLYHPQRRAILHLKNQRKKIKDKTKIESRPPYFDFSSLRSRTVRITLLSAGFVAAGLYTPVIYLAQEAGKEVGRDAAVWLQLYFGLAWMVGTLAVGLLVVVDPADCKIARQYLCQAGGFVCGLSLLSLPISLPSPHDKPNYTLHIWAYGIGLGMYNYTLKMFVYQTVRARNFARVWGFVQGVQGLAVAAGIPLSGYIAISYGIFRGYYLSSASILFGVATMFLIDLRKWRWSRKNKTCRNKPSNSVVGNNSAAQDAAYTGNITEDAVSQHSSQARIRKDSFADDEPYSPPLAILQQTSIFFAQLGNIPPAELTCISEEGIADMDIPDHVLEELEFAADCITSCDKVENYLMMSEYENNLVKPREVHARKQRKWSLFHQKSSAQNNDQSPVRSSQNGNGFRNRASISLKPVVDNTLPKEVQDTV